MPEQRTTRRTTVRGRATCLSCSPLAAVAGLATPAGPAIASQLTPQGTAADQSDGPADWTNRPPVTYARVGSDGATVGGRILVIGGFNPTPAACLTTSRRAAFRVPAAGQPWHRYPLRGPTLPQPRWEGSSTSPAVLVISRYRCRREVPTPEQVSGPRAGSYRNAAEARRPPRWAAFCTLSAASWVPETKSALRPSRTTQ